MSQGLLDPTHKFREFDGVLFPLLVCYGKAHTWMRGWLLEPLDENE